MVGELSLEGRTRPAKGVLSMAIAAAASCGLRGSSCPNRARYCVRSYANTVPEHRRLTAECCRLAAYVIMAALIDRQNFESVGTV